MTPARSRSATSRASRCGSRTSGSWGGSSTRPRSSRARCGTRCSRPASRTGCSRPATARSTRCGWRRAIARGARTSRPTTRRSRPGSAFAVAEGKDSSATRRSSGVLAPRARRARLVCLTLTDPRSSTLGNEPVRAGGDVVARVTARRDRLRRRRQHRVRVPARRAGGDRARRSRSRCSATGSTPRSPTSRSGTRRANDPVLATVDPARGMSSARRTRSRSSTPRAGRAASPVPCGRSGAPRARVSFPKS